MPEDGSAESSSSASSSSAMDGVRVSEPWERRRVKADVTFVGDEGVEAESGRPGDCGWYGPSLKICTVSVAEVKKKMAAAGFEVRAETDA